MPERGVILTQALVLVDELAGGAEAQTIKVTWRGSSNSVVVGVDSM